MQQNLILQQTLCSRPLHTLGLATIISLGLLLMTGCATTTPTWDSGPAVPAKMPTEQWTEKAQAYQQQASQAPAEDANGLWISAADAWLQAGQTDRTKDAMRWVNRDTLNASERARLDLVLADLALRSSRPDEAEALLAKARDALPASSTARYEDLYTRLAEQLSGPASQDIARAAQLSDSMNFYDPIGAVDMMVTLEPVPSGELAIRALNPRAERRFTGWLDLALVIRRNLVRPEGIHTAITEWKVRHPYHLLTEGQALDTWLHYRQRFAPPRRVAVLLPETGRLQAAGDAIRDGLMSAYLQQPGGAELLFFPTGDDPQSAVSAYFSALDAGADWIIGPLRKESIEAMLSLAGMTTPVLALNDLPEAFMAPAGLEGRIRGISLSQEQEVSAVADHALASGYRKAIVLAPETEWGERMAWAFESEFLREDTEIVTALRYVESQNDHSAVLQRALKIDQSKQRKRQLENTLQTRLEFEPVRRQDVDVIFMAASTTQARQIRPQLRFHDAGDIPLYATGRVYNGQPESRGNRDLNGIRFPTTPWQLAHTSEQEMPGLASIRGGNLAALHALGRDAWNLLPWIGLMNKDPDFSFNGQSGHYQAKAFGAMRREPAWAVFRNGRPEPLPAPVAGTNARLPAGG